MTDDKTTPENSQKNETKGMVKSPISELVQTESERTVANSFAKLIEEVPSLFDKYLQNVADVKKIESDSNKEIELRRIENHNAIDKRNSDTNNTIDKRNKVTLIGYVSICLTAYFVFSSYSYDTSIINMIILLGIPIFITNNKSVANYIDTVSKSFKKDS